MNSNSETHIPLVVDLDGTLLKSDMLHECGMQFIRTKPLKTLTLLSWLRLGKAKFKERLADSVEIDVSVLPYDIEVINFISAEKKKSQDNPCHCHSSFLSATYCRSLRFIRSRFRNNHRPQFEFASKARPHGRDLWAQRLRLRRQLSGRR